MKSNNIKALKSGIWYAVGNFISKGMIFLVSPIFNRLLSKGEVGDFSNFSAWITILAIIVTLDLHSAVSVARFDYKNELDNFIASALVLGSIVTFFFYVIAIVWADDILNVIGFNNYEFHIAFIYFLVCPALQMFQIKSRIEYKYVLSTFMSIFSSFLATGISLFCVLHFGDRLKARVIGNYVPLIFLNIILYLFFLSKSKNISLKYWKYILAISVPLAIHLLAGNILNLSDRIMIKKICGNEAAGMYSVAYSCGMIISVMWAAINGAWSPWAYEQMDSKQFDILKKAEKYLVAVWGIFVFVVMLFGPELLLFMGGEKYVDAKNVIPPVMAAYGIQAIYTFYCNIEIYSKKQKYIAINTSIVSIINIILNYYYIYKIGYIAAAFTTLLGYILMLVMHMFVVRCLGRGKWYDAGYNIGFAFLFVFVMGGMLWLYKFNVLRYIFICICVVIGLIIGFLKREFILKMIIKYKHVIR